MNNFTDQEIEPARLDISGLTVAYGDTVAIDNISFSINHGFCVAVIGPNGAGKSTLFKALMGLLKPEKGTILIHGRPLGHHFDCVSFIPQREEIDWSFPVTVRDVVMMGRYRSISMFRKKSKKDCDIAKQSMQTMGIYDLADRQISELSGGQQQRVFISRAITQRPHVLLMDEPFNGIDMVTQDIIWGLLQNLKNDNVTVLIATHDLSLAAKKFDSVMLLNRKVISYGKPETVMTKNNLVKAYGSQLLYMDSHIVADNCC